MPIPPRKGLQGKSAINIPVWIILAQDMEPVPAQAGNAGIGKWLSVDPLAEKYYEENSKYTPEQQAEIGKNIGNAFTNAGINDVNVYVNPGFLDHVATFFNDVLSLDFKTGNGPEYSDGSVAAGMAELGSTKGEAYEGSINDGEDILVTTADESVTKASNVGTHELGHASGAKLTHSKGPDGTTKSDDGSVMNYRTDGKKLRDFSEWRIRRNQKEHKELGKL
jgi:hypothetical protein